MTLPPGRMHKRRSVRQEIEFAAAERRPGKLDPGGNRQAACKFPMPLYWIATPDRLIATLHGKARLCEALQQ